jgi:hypothetical protein
MKRLIVLVAAAAVVASASATAGAAPRPVAATLDGTATSVAGWCCGRIDGLDGRGVVAGIGAVTFSGSYLHGVDPYVTFVEGQGFTHPYGVVRQLNLTLTAANGDAIVIAGSTRWSEADPQPPLTWAVVSSTGRFAGGSGSGTYDVSIEGSHATITLGGSLHA